jgi:hypothetical protein
VAAGTKPDASKDQPARGRAKAAAAKSAPVASKASGRRKGQRGSSATSSSATAPDLAAFVDTMAEKWRQREHLLNVVRQFYEFPQQFGLHPEVIPHGSGAQEVKEATEYLEYRISLLRVLLGAMEEELHLLKAAAKSPASTTQAGRRKKAK